MIRLQHEAEIRTHNTGIPEVADMKLNTAQHIYHETLKQIDKFDFYFNKIELWDGMKKPKLLASSETDKVMKALSGTSDKKWIMEGLPKLADKIKPHLKGVDKHKGLKL